MGIRGAPTGLRGEYYSARWNGKWPALEASGWVASTCDTLSMNDQPDDAQKETLAHQLHRSGRKGRAAPFGLSFVQQGPQKNPRPGPLSLMVRGHDEHALDLYLLQRALASSEPWDVTRDSRVWARMVGHSGDSDEGRAAVSKGWARLDQKYGLVTRSRRGRLAKITALADSGDRSAYAAPSAPYFRLPFDYWLDSECWYRRLSLPGKAVLMIALTLKPGFVLPSERGPIWYGVSPDTVERGLVQLRNEGLLRYERTKVKDLGSGAGFRFDYRYWLTGPFASRRHATGNSGSSAP